MSSAAKSIAAVFRLFAGEGRPQSPISEFFTGILNDLTFLRDRVRSRTLSTGGLAIKAGGSAVVKAASAVVYAAAGTLVRKAANTDMAALAGTVTNAKFNVFAFFGDSAGTLTTSMGTEGATLAAVVFPTVPANKALLGFVIINPTGTGNFVGGTTALDDATVVPNAVYVDCLGAFDPGTDLELTA
jgi:hypothetical protein